MYFFVHYCNTLVYSSGGWDQMKRVQFERSICKSMQPMSKKQANFLHNLKGKSSDKINLNNNSSWWNFCRIVNRLLDCLFFNLFVSNQNVESSSPLPGRARGRPSNKGETFDKDFHYCS